MKVRKFSCYAEERKSCSFINKLFLREPMTKARCAATCEWCLRDPLSGCGTAVGRLVCMERVRVSVGKLRVMRARENENCGVDHVNERCAKHSRTARMHKWREIHETCAEMVEESPTLQKWVWRSSWGRPYASDVCGDPFHLHSLSRLLNPFFSTAFQSVGHTSVRSGVVSKRGVMVPGNNCSQL